MIGVRAVTVTARLSSLQATLLSLRTAKHAQRNSSMQIGAYSASIHVDGEPLPEYGLETSADGKEVSCWIPSEAGKAFTPNFRDSAPSLKYTTLAKLNVDDVRCPGTYLGNLRPGHSGRLSHQPGHVLSESKIETIATGPYSRRQIVFGSRVLTDDDAYLDQSISPHAGTIQVAFSHCVRHANTDIASAFHVPKANAIHERSKKAAAHVVEFGPEIGNDGHTLNRTSSCDHVRTLARMVFKYRPIELLRAQGIAPQLKPKTTPVDNPTVLDLTLDEDADDGEEIQRLEARLHSLREKNPNKRKIKDEPDVGGSVKRKKIKNESSSFRLGEVIDLT
ncbi:unnamed protein product [Mycena citricolor]|uniref:DUF7918 domain-containing protein n=1 Tax=Mycena citricolor TaxID=2018698 RepID=A0AAD2K4T6_9AGAR|nr:unnamed protein product [Mycena citricolor]